MTHPTQLVSSYSIEKKTYQNSIEKAYQQSLEQQIKEAWKNIFEATLIKAKALMKQRWVAMDKHDFLYDHRIQACWAYDNQDQQFIVQEKIESGTSRSDVNNLIDQHYDYPDHLQTQLTLPTEIELITSLHKQTDTPFELENGRPSYPSYNWSYQENDCSKNMDMDSSGAAIGTSFGSAVSAVSAVSAIESAVSAIGSTRSAFSKSFWEDLGDSIIMGGCPLLRLGAADDRFALSEHKVFHAWLKQGLVPTALADDERYQTLLQYPSSKAIMKKLKNLPLKKRAPLFKQLQLDGSLNTTLFDILTEVDTLRADLLPYDGKMLEDIDQGHWDLWPNNTNNNDTVTLDLDPPLVARDPASRIANGVVGIDFGTKSTVVAYQKGSTLIQPMRVGTGNLSRKVQASHYENPTIMEFNDLQQFIDDYQQQAGRPHTRWQDLTISHTAFSALMNSSSRDFNAFLNELKQWAGTPNKKLKVVDKKQNIFDFPTFLELADNDINPIEIYAYYLGLYINNQRNGIFMDYILSFPVTYEVSIRDKIIDSFYRGLKKSLPESLHQQPEQLQKLRVSKGASEPAAYAIIALQENGFDPEDDEQIFYGVFDFGGGTTDFDFGIYREANGRKERRYDYAIEHFGAGGDRYLGGENLLALLAFEIFKENQTELAQRQIQFNLPPECPTFLGHEMLLSQSREAKMNSKILMEALRGFWEQDPEQADTYQQGSLGINLFNTKGEEQPNIELDIDPERMKAVLYQRIHRGVINFFESLRLAFSHHASDLSHVEQVNIFLAGNSSKSPWVTELFEQEINRVVGDMQSEGLTSGDDFFKLYPPLSGDDLNKPNGKTGVAYGLIAARHGGKILVMDHNIKEEISFKYYLGHSKKHKFNVVIDRQNPYHQWVEFIDASCRDFELYFSSVSAVSTNKTPISDHSIKLLRLEIEQTHEDASVYLRLISPTEIEYVVAEADRLEAEEYIGSIKKIALTA